MKVKAFLQDKSFALSMTVLWCIVFTNCMERWTGLFMGLCMGMAFGLFESKEKKEERE